MWAALAMPGTHHRVDQQPPPAEAPDPTLARGTSRRSAPGRPRRLADTGAGLALAERQLMSGDQLSEPDMVLTLAEADYCYGTGPLTMRIDDIGADPTTFRRLEWVRVTGREIWPDGTEHPREVMARVSAIQRSLRPAAQAPDTGSET
jgi:hypothetical protein